MLMLVGVLAGCRNDMHDQPRYKPLRRSDFFLDGRSERPLIPGTVPRGYLKEDAYFYTGMVGNNQPGNELPFPLTAQVLRRGQERFDIYCQPCHSRVGDGNGMIVQRGFRRAASYHTDALRAAPLGHFFDVMTNGFGAMPDYSQQLQPADRWAVAAYIRALQLSQHATLADVPADQRNNISNEPSTVPSIGGTGTMGEIPAPTGAAGAGEPATLGNEAAPGQMVTPQQQQGQPLPPSQQPYSPGAPTPQQNPNPAVPQNPRSPQQMQNQQQQQQQQPRPQNPGGQPR